MGQGCAKRTLPLIDLKQTSNLKQARCGQFDVSAFSMPANRVDTECRAPARDGRQLSDVADFDDFVLDHATGGFHRNDITLFLGDQGASQRRTY